jgi:DNA-binding SARP family transcriptional activator
LTLDPLLRDRDAAVRAAARRARTRLDARPRPTIRLATLGRLSVSRDGVVLPDVAFGRQKARALLGLLVSVRAPLHRDAAIEWLWPELPPENARAALNVTLHELRRALQPELDPHAPSSLVVAQGETIRLELGPRDEWDVTQFLSLCRPAGGSESAQEEIARLLRAEAAYTGTFLADWPYAEWAERLRNEIEERRREMLQALGESLARAGRSGEAIRRYRLLVSLEPEREGWHRALMRAYGAAGERALALRQYHACRTVLRREQGIEPGAETRALYRQMLMNGDKPAGGASPVAADRVPEGTVTIVFTDIEGSTETAERLGDRRWFELLTEHDRLLRRHAAAHSGYEVKSQGDGLMLAFPSARGAIDFSVAVQRAIHERNAEVAGEPLRVRIGMHTGEAIRQGEDFLGRAVTIAARIAGVCAGQQIAVSDLVRELTESAGDLRFVDTREVELKGIAERQRVHLVDWRDPVSPL